MIRIKYIKINFFIIFYNFFTASKEIQQSTKKLSLVHKKIVNEF